MILVATGILIFKRLEKNGPYLSFAGFTQGTTYHITYASPGTDTVYLQKAVDSLLRDFDLSLSTWVENSLISRINRNEADSLDSYMLGILRFYQ